jgi:hypothetical protein
VTQTGVAILFSVLLTVPFSARFEDVDPFTQGVYVTALLLSAATTVTLIGPVAFHRLLFAKGRKPHLVRLGNRMAVTGLGLLCLTLGAVLLLVTDVVLDRSTAVVLSAVFTVGHRRHWSVPRGARPARPGAADRPSSRGGVSRQREALEHAVLDGRAEPARDQLHLAGGPGRARRTPRAAPGRAGRGGRRSGAGGTAGARRRRRRRGRPAPRRRPGR